MKITTKNLDETHEAAQEFIASINSMVSRGQLGGGAVVIGLSGDLGSGKTAFVQGVAKSLGIEDKVISPTFVIQKRYDVREHDNFKSLLHIDAYRLEKPEEIVSIGWRDSIKNKNNVIFVEWPEKIESLLPKGHQKIVFEFIDPEKRSIDIV